MTSSAEPLPAPTASSWRVSRDGVAVATVAIGPDGTGIVGAANVAAATAGAGPHRFDTLQAAEALVGDLIASFAYLGCDVAAA